MLLVAGGEDVAEIQGRFGRGGIGGDGLLVGRYRLVATIEQMKGFADIVQCFGKTGTDSQGLGVFGYRFIVAFDFPEGVG